MAIKNISKSRFIAGLQCEKRLWLEIHERNLADEVDDQTQAIFDQGHEVGELAQTLFPGGVLIDEDHLHIPEAVKSTEKAIQSGVSTIYEATAIHDRFLSRIDILQRVKEGSNEWDMIEVKGSSSVKGVYLYDLAIQKYIFEGAGYHIRKTILCHLNNRYIREGPLEIEKLFILSDETNQVNRLIKNMPVLTEKFLKVVDAKHTPNVPIGGHCNEPYSCEFIGHCWKDVPEDSVFTLVGRKPFVSDLYQKGITRVTEIPETIKLSIKQRKQIEVTKAGKPYWKMPAVKAFLESLEYPLSFLDFETFMLAIPPYDGSWSYGSIPSQFSLHVMEQQRAEPKHYEFLGDGKTDPRSGFMEALIKSIPPKGSVVVYSSYEARILRETAAFLPKYKSKANEIIRRFKDLLIPFRNQDILYPEFHGSAGLKSVLPVLVPEMSYENLEIGDGSSAVVAYVKLMDPEVEEIVKKKIRKDLLVYCGQDTKAMVKLVEVLGQKVGIGH